MFIDQYFSEPNGNLCFTRQQASDFAKRVADDFNPLHDTDARRFCVPGDLLFSVVLARYGVSQHMHFVFSGMVVEDIELLLPPTGDELRIRDAQDKEYLSVQRSGENSRDESLVQNLTRNYVEFSGHTFPHILEPLLAEQSVMINPDRPMVIYESMTIDLDRLDITDPELHSDHNELEISGRRGSVNLVFNLVEAGEVVGRGRKRMLLSGLREYDRAAMDAAIETYNARKRDFFAAAPA